MAVRPPVATVNAGSAATAPATACSSSPTSQSRHVPRPPPSVAVLLDIKRRPPASTTAGARTLQGSRRPVARSPSASAVASPHRCARGGPCSALRRRPRAIPTCCGLAPLFFVRQRAHDVTARFPVALEREHAAPLGFLEQPVERAESIIRLGESGLP